MKLIEVQNSIVMHFDRFWDSSPIEHQNTTIEKDNVTEWVRLTVHHHKPEPLNFKNDAIRFGAVSIQVFTEPDIGQGLAVELAVKAAELIRKLAVGTLVFKPYELIVLGNKATEGLTTTETRWFQVNAVIEFSYVD